MAPYEAAVFQEFIRGDSVAGDSRLQEGIRAAVAGADRLDDIASGFARKYDETLLSLTASVSVGRPPIELSQRFTIQVTRIPRAPYLTLVILDIIYAAIGTCLAIAAAIAILYGQGVNDAQVRLSTQAVVAESFESPAWGDDATKIDELFAERRGKLTKRLAFAKCAGGGRRYKRVVAPFGDLNKRSLNVPSNSQRAPVDPKSGRTHPSPP